MVPLPLKVEGTIVILHVVKCSNIARMLQTVAVDIASACAETGSCADSSDVLFCWSPLVTVLQTRTLGPRNLRPEYVRGANVVQNVALRKRAVI